MTALLLNFLLDDSGSMKSVREATISGYNEFLDTQRSLPGVVLFTLCTFEQSQNFKVVNSAVPIAQVPALHEDSYMPNGGRTALYDGICDFLDVVEQNFAIAELQTPAGEALDVVNVIITDGGENGSHRFTQNDAFKRITDLQKDKGWNVVYLGANQDAYAVGGGLGIKSGSTRTYAGTKAGTHAAFATASSSLRSYRESRAGGQSVSYNADILAGAPETITGEEPESNKGVDK